MRLGKYIALMIKSELEEMVSVCDFTVEEEMIVKMLHDRKSVSEIAYKLNTSTATVGRRIEDVKTKIERSGVMDGKVKVPLWEKMNLTIEEAAEYSNIGINKLQELTKNPTCTFVLYIGKKKLIKRKLFEKYIEQSIEL